MKTIFIILALSFLTTGNAQFISDDDLKHFAVGTVISGATYSLVYAKTKNKSKAFWYSLGASTLAGLSKEIYDGYIISGRFDTGELASTMVGGFVASYTFNIFTGKKNKKKKEQQASLTN
ncbi:hypothetical protein [Winogradskyella sp.]|uniref:hypothetical protein n=1 Tax=Winogradskyella sp. TaxID=1883156 RepID=UPI0025F2A69A|nr:hypothetical protein [Winogradskyella sp.]